MMSLLQGQWSQYVDPDKLPKRSFTQSDEGECFVDGKEVSHATYLFCEKLRKERAFKDCRFHVRHFNRVEVYFENELHFRGGIGYGDVGKEAYIPRYYVQAENIENFKMRNHRQLFRIKSSEDIGRAVRAAKQHLRAFSEADELENLPFYWLRDQLAADVTDSRDNAYNKEREVKKLIPSMLRQLLRTHVNGESKISNVQLRDRVDELHEAYREQVTSITYNVQWVFKRDGMIRVYAIGPVTFGTDNANYDLLRRPTLDATADVYAPDDVPKEMLAALHTLKLLEADSSYIEGLGARVNKNLYVLVEEVDRVVGTPFDG